MSGVELYLAFVAVTVVLMLMPGPDVALITANSMAHGICCGLLTVAGISAAMPELSTFKRCWAAGWYWSWQSGCDLPIGR